MKVQEFRNSYLILLQRLLIHKQKKILHTQNLHIILNDEML